MEARPRTLENHVTPDGKEPFEIWLGTLDPKVRHRIRVRLDRAEEGNLGDHHGVGEGVSELVFIFGSGYRVYYGEDGDVIVLLTGGDKSTQARDIEKAMFYWRDYCAQED